MPSCRLPRAARHHARRLALLVLAVGATAAGLSGCAPTRAAGLGSPVPVVASFYPLQFATEQIGGTHVQVTDLTKPGAEPHDLELTPRAVATVSTARLVIYEKDLQPAVDQAVAAEAADHALDVAPVANLDLTFHAGLGGDHAAQGHVENAPGTVDPHFWLDPVRYSHVATAIARRLSQVDPAHRSAYERNLASFRSRLDALDTAFSKGLASCARTELVTSHSAFGYLAERYGFTQVGITGLSPEAEPEPATLAAVSGYVRAHDVTTVYTEPLVSAAVADTVARETGARTAVLDPIEGLTKQSKGSDYFEVMRSNLATLEAGQGCS